MEFDGGGQSLNVTTIVNLQPLAIHDPAMIQVGKGRVHLLNCYIRLHILDGEGARPLGSKLPREEPDPRVKQQDLLLVDFGGLISIEPNLF